MTKLYDIQMVNAFADESFICAFLGEISVDIQFELSPTDGSGRKALHLVDVVFAVLYEHWVRTEKNTF